MYHFILDFIVGFYFITMSSENRFEMLGVTNVVTTFYKAVYKCVYNNNNKYIHSTFINPWNVSHRNSGTIIHSEKTTLASLARNNYYEWAKRTKILLAVIYGSPGRHSNSSKFILKKSEKMEIHLCDHLRTSWII